MVAVKDVFEAMPPFKELEYGERVDSEDIDAALRENVDAAIEAFGKWVGAPWRGRLRWFRAATPDIDAEAWRDRIRAAAPGSQMYCSSDGNVWCSPLLNGAADPHTGDVWLRADMHPLKAAVVVIHELFHLVNGPDENAAHAFSDQIAAALGLTRNNGC